MKKLLDIMSRLRDPETGCPWDLKQNYQSLVAYTLEEAYEVAEVIEQDRLQDLPSELGDLLFQIVFYSEIAQQENRFTFDDVVTSISEKLIRRHPHVFNKNSSNVLNLSDPNAIQKQNISWGKIKQQERDDRSSSDSNSNSNSNFGTSHLSESILDNINTVLPALAMAQKIQTRVSNVGFDWPEIKGVIAKCHEELKEVEHEISINADSSDLSNSNIKGIEEELGDLLFACVNLARHCQLDAEAALRRANYKFEQRFRKLEQRLEGKGGVQSASLSEMDDAWNAVKDAEGNRNHNRLHRSD